MSMAKEYGCDQAAVNVGTALQLRVAVTFRAATVMFQRPTSRPESTTRIVTLRHPAKETGARGLKQLAVA
ncbi:hypothetical protein ACFFX1_43390 [Dactylosporangium sucinum]|uniref:Uncharacterized protein n=1 Tax=Dactylosporangium sucinum TaxID=1424081 RepID=A0A917X681_9ACTN|nr:hypothetical protein [Dactylosporangium sucinum]GGM75433.1 hypothetical protein GCM10007977_091280 [Dactylosporangium sucinum]